MVDAELGTKRTCPSCAVRFYDLSKNPIICPACEVSFVAETLLPSKNDTQTAAAATARPQAEEAEKEKTPEDVEIVSLDDVEGDVEEDETAAIADVDLGDDDVAVEAGDDDDDTFLETDDDDGSNVVGLDDLEHSRKPVSSHGVAQRGAGTSGREGLPRDHRPRC